MHFDEKHDSVERNPQCGLSWGGFNVHGDARSIAEVQRLINAELASKSAIEALQERLTEFSAKGKGYIG